MKFRCQIVVATLQIWDFYGYTAGKVLLRMFLHFPLISVLLFMDSTLLSEMNQLFFRKAMLPVRFLANSLSVSNDNIAWDSATNTATLVK